MQVAFLARKLEMLATENREIKNNVTALEAENTLLKQQMEARPLPPVPPFYFTVYNYRQYKKDNCTIMSPPFILILKGTK